MKWADDKTGCSTHFWGRSIGWYLMAIVDILDFVPLDNLKNKILVDILKSLIASIISFQDELSGGWYQIVNMGKVDGNYLESSATCMFTYSMLKAIRKGYIDSSYLKYAQKAYKGIIQNLLILII